MLLFGLGIGVLFLVILWCLILSIIILSKSQSAIVKASLVVVGIIISGFILILPQETLHSPAEYSEFKRVYSHYLDSSSSLRLENLMDLCRPSTIFFTCVPSHNDGISSVLDEFFFTRVAALTVLCLSVIGGFGSIVYSFSEPLLAGPLEKLDY